MRERVLNPVSSEIRLAGLLRSLAIKAINTLNEKEEELLIEKLGVLPRWLEVQKSKKEWPLETAYRVCYFLNLDVLDIIEQLIIKMDNCIYSDPIKFDPVGARWENQPSGNIDIKDLTLEFENIFYKK